MALRTVVFLGTVFVLATVLALVGPAQEYLPDLDVEHPAIDYFDSPSDDPIARLAGRFAAGEIRFAPGNDDLGYLPSLLAHLEINIDLPGPRVLEDILSGAQDLSGQPTSHLFQRRKWPSPSSAAAIQSRSRRLTRNWGPFSTRLT